MDLASEITKAVCKYLLLEEWVQPDCGIDDIEAFEDELYQSVKDVVRAELLKQEINK